MMPLPTLRGGLLRNAPGRPSFNPTASSNLTRPFSLGRILRYPAKDTQDKDSLKPHSTEYSKSGGDDAAASKTEKAAFDPTETRPESEHETGREESGGSDSNNPLNVSPANQDISQPRDTMEGGAETSSKEGGGTSGRARTSGGGSPKKSGGSKSG